ncbi:MAG TPA: quinone-dependent dihydroorotate dehydrogenase, partial [Vampirovibrionales bacterium]
INVSSPNTPGLREWQNASQLKTLLEPIKQECIKPVFVKISPDITIKELGSILQVINDLKIDGVIATNTTISREDAPPQYTQEAGGISGELVKAKSLEVLKWIQELKPKYLNVISVGGISTAEDVKQRLELGADLIQIYSGLVYKGPNVVSEINKYFVS